MLTQEGKALVVSGDEKDGVIKDADRASIRIDNVKISFSKKHGAGKLRTVTIEYELDGKVIGYTLLDNFTMRDTINIAGQGMRIPVTFTW